MYYNIITHRMAQCGYSSISLSSLSRAIWRAYTINNVCYRPTGKIIISSRAELVHKHFFVVVWFSAFFSPLSFGCYCIAWLWHLKCLHMHYLSTSFEWGLRRWRHTCIKFYIHASSIACLYFLHLLFNCSVRFDSVCLVCVACSCVLTGWEQYRQRHDGDHVKHIVALIKFIMTDWQLAGRLTDVSEWMNMSGWATVIYLFIIHFIRAEMHVDNPYRFPFGAFHYILFYDEQNDVYTFQHQLLSK